jgi:hypothetical protein
MTRRWWEAGRMDDLLVALVSCGGLVSLPDLTAAVAAWCAAQGRTPPDVDVEALDGASFEVVPNGADVLVRPTEGAPWLTGALLRDVLGSAVFFDQAAWAGEATDAARDDVFAAARRTYDTRAVRWQPRVRRSRPGAPPYLPPQRDPIARLGLVARLLDRDDAEARAWVTGLLPAGRAEWTALDRDALLEALPSFADLLTATAAATVAEMLAGDERHGFGWTGLGALHVTTPNVFPDDVWDDVRKRFRRWVKRRTSYGIDDEARAALQATAHDLGVEDL